MPTRSLIRVFLGVATLVVVWNFARGPAVPARAADGRPRLRGALRVG